MNKKKAGKRLAQMDETKTFGPGLSFAAAEAYRLLRTNILFALPDTGQCRIIGITSALSGEGKSTTALNLAYMLAEDGKRVLLVEADMRLPTVVKRLGLNSSLGLSNLLAGLCGREEVLQVSGVQEKLWVMASGDIPPNPSELLGSEQMKNAVGLLSEGFDFMLLDLPPVTEVSDALTASRLVDGMLVVVRQNYADRASLAEAMRQLQYVGAKLIGFAVTCADSQGGKYKSYKKGGCYGYESASGRS